MLTYACFSPPSVDLLVFVVAVERRSRQLDRDQELRKQLAAEAAIVEAAVAVVEPLVQEFEACVV